MTTKYNDCFSIIYARLFFLITLLQKLQLHLNKANITISQKKNTTTVQKRVLPFLPSVLISGPASTPSTSYIGSIEFWTN